MTESARQNYEGVWDGRLGFGRKAALIVIDLLQGYTTEGSPLYAAGVVACVKEMPELLERARAKSVPVLHTRIRFTPPHYADGGIWIQKAPVLKALVAGNPYAEFCEEVVPREGEIVIVKQYASAFFGTALIGTLNGLGVDTLIITGCTTSGCVRATAVDALQHGIRPICVRECIGDRHPEPHEANLFDIDAKYGDVIGKREALTYLDGL